MSTEVKTPVTPEAQTTAAPAQPANSAVVPPTTTTTPVAPAAAAVTSAITEPAKTEPEKVVPPAAAKVVPEKYDIKLPEGSKLDPSFLAKFSELSKAKGLSNEEAQKELSDASAFAENIQEGSVKLYEQAQADKLKTERESWLEQAKKDPEIGGEKFNESLIYARRAIAKINDPDLVKILNSSGLGDHPAFIRSFAKLGRGIADDKAVTTGDPASGKKDKGAILYDKTT